MRIIIILDIDEVECEGRAYTKVENPTFIAADRVDDLIQKIQDYIKEQCDKEGIPNG